MKRLIPLVFLFALAASGNTSGVFQATPLIDFKPSQLYLGKFPGFLFQGSNQAPPQHDADGKSFAAKVVPLDSNGLPSATGKIVAVAIGMSNWTDEVCGGNFDKTENECNPGTFIQQAEANSSVNHSTLVLVDCAAGGQDALRWTSNAWGNYTNCKNFLSSQGLTENQVEVILWKDADASPVNPLTSKTLCGVIPAPPALPPATTPDACRYEAYVGEVARYVKTRYPHAQQMFLHSRIYAGYATTNLNPEPFAYEYGFATKWTIQAQINEQAGGATDPTAGNLRYSAAPWMTWGAYFWASDDTPRSDGLVWVRSDLESDGTHPSQSGREKVANLMMNYFLNSAYSPWFRAPKN